MLLRRLVGFIVDQDQAAQPREGHLLIDDDRIVGRVTSCAYSPTLEKVIGLAYAPPTLADPGSRLSIRVDGRPIAAEVVALPFYDPGNQRQEHS